MNILSWALVLLVSATPSLQDSVLGQRSLPQLTAEEMLKLVATPDPLNNLDPSNSDSHLAHILIPRVPETSNNTIVRNYIISTLKALKWHIEEDDFIDETPIGPRRFVNVVATKNPDAPRKVSLAAHYDSKYFPPGDSNYGVSVFLGATDSAAPCAILLDLAETLDPLLEARKHRPVTGLEDDEDVQDTTLQLIFFDGEEAFVQWTDTDSTYGARHLAQKWATTYVQPYTKRRLMNTQATELSTIEHLILLDLLGAPNPSIRSYYLETAWLFDSLISVEQRLGRAGAFAYGDEQSMAPSRWRTFFRPRSEFDAYYGQIGDDHVPFLRRGVSILHLIAVPFPHVWHTLSDDASALHLPTLRRWNILMRVFISEYLHLRPVQSKRSEMYMKWETDLKKAMIPSTQTSDVR